MDGDQEVEEEFHGRSSGGNDQEEAWKASGIRTRWKRGLSGARGGGTHGLEKGRIPDTPSSTPMLKRNTQTTLQLQTDLKSVIGSSQKQTPDPRIRLSQFTEVESSSTSASSATSQEGGKQDVNMTPEDSDEEL
ncbi:MAG: hypothetical protein MMC33_010753 [Icmadophila ericetorum]|nr:hypothetical protein [Icmadophila ericetorum]